MMTRESHFLSCLSQ